MLLIFSVHEVKEAMYEVKEAMYEVKEAMYTETSRRIGLARCLPFRLFQYVFRVLIFVFLCFHSTSLLGTAPYAVYQGHQGGFFAAFTVIVGMLDAYDRKEFSGIEVSFGESELYYDPAHGPNWWEYYFLPIRTHKPHKAKRTILRGETARRAALLGFIRLSRERCHELIDKYVKIKPEIVREVEGFLEKHLHGEMLIGVHYRGTDKFGKEAEYISPQAACLKIEECLCSLPKEGVKIFVATDSDNFLQIAKQTFGEKVIYLDMKRSENDHPIHMNGFINGYLSGKMALLDCIILSRCNLLLRTSSNLSNVSMLFNPSLPVIRLNHAVSGRNDDRTC